MITNNKLSQASVIKVTIENNLTLDQLGSFANETRKNYPFHTVKVLEYSNKKAVLLCNPITK